MNRPDVSLGRAARVLLAACGLPAAALTCGLWLSLAIGCLGTLGWSFDLFANFRVQYLGLFAICVIALTITRRRRMAVVALLGVAITTASMAPYLREHTHAMPSNGAFRLVTFNIWFRNDDLAPTANFLEHADADVIVLQEVNLPEAGSLAGALRSYPHHVQTPNVRRGVAIFSRTPITEVEHVEIPGRVTRITRAKVEWRGESVTIIAAHLSWPVSPDSARQRARELEIIAERVRRETGPVIVAGDLNLTPWSRFFARFVAQSGLADCALGQGIFGTWPSQAVPLRIRIDHCFASPHWFVHDVAVGPRLGSDHLPVIVTLGLTKRD